MKNFISFHVQLRYERERRGWSQADTASQIGIDTKTIARWESGESLPRPYHRRALCELFEKDAEDFGLVSIRKETGSSSFPETDVSPSELTVDISHAVPSPPESSRRMYQNIEGLPPPTSPRTIQQRDSIVQDIYRKLLQNDTTAVALTGIGGVGKSTLAALVYCYELECNQTSESPFASPPLWLTVNESVTLIDLVGTLLETLGEPLPDLERLTPHNQVMTLFRALHASDHARLIVLDQFENMLDWQTGYALPERPGVGEWLDALNSQFCPCKILLTSRPWPRGTHDYPSTYMHEYPIAGLEVAEGVELLRQQGVRDKQATDLQLRAAVVRCDGHAFALTLLASLLKRNPSLTLALLFENTLYKHLWDGDIAHNLLGYIYLEQFDDVQRELLSAFAIYREPVPLEACIALTNFHGTEQHVQVLSALRVLLTQHFLQACGDAHYQLHVIVAQYAREYALREHKEQTLHHAHLSAAHYYLSLSPAKPSLKKEQQRKINDVLPLVEALWHLCQAHLWQEAFDLIRREGIFLTLRRWGRNATLLEFYQYLFPLEKWNPSLTQEAEISEQLGRVYGTLGKKELALEHYERALSVYKAREDHLN
jgi:transcriptional regulator with XRE-family HTH domain/tetratricopeptide (TPR) repeat protein